MSGKFSEDKEKGRVGELALFPFMAAEAQANGGSLTDVTAACKHFDYLTSLPDGTRSRGEVKHAESARLPFEVRANSGLLGWAMLPDVETAAFVRSFGGTRRYFRFNTHKVREVTRNFSNLPKNANFFEHTKGKPKGEGSAVAYICPLELMALGCGEELPKAEVEAAFSAFLGDHGSPENAQCYERYAGERLTFPLPPISPA